ncbi:MAG: OmpA family protein [Pseudomonadota bacterium]
MTSLRVLPVVIAACLASTALAQTPGDSLFNLRFPGAEIVAEDQQNFTEAPVYTGEMKSAFETEAVEMIEGSLRQILFSTPPEASVLEVFRAYQQEIEAAGFSELYACAKEAECGGRIPYMFATEKNVKFRFGEDFRYALYDLTQGEGREIAQLLVQKPREGNPTFIVLEVIQTEAEAQTLKMLSASEIGAAIDSTGTAAIYGLEFASGSAELLPASEPVLAEMAGFMQSRPDAEILLVGHTDNVGALDFNLSLSQQRSNAVRDALTSRFGIPAGQLSAHGVGFLAPTAPNTSDDGRARNRRVEMILR